MRPFAKPVPIWVLSVAMLLIPTTAPAVTDCTAGSNVGGTLNMSDDYATTSSTNTCLTVTGTNATINCNGHSITCNNAAGCGIAVLVTAAGVKVENCRIVPGTGNWNVGIFGNTDTIVLRNYIKGSAYGIALGDELRLNVIVETRAQCITSGLAAFAANTEIRENYCQSEDDGMVVTHPGSGAAVRVEENYVRADDVGLAQGANLVTFEKNIVDAPTPFYFGEPAEATLIDNICADLGQCPNPGATPFGLSVTVN